MSRRDILHDTDHALDATRRVINRAPGTAHPALCTIGADQAKFNIIGRPLFDAGTAGGDKPCTVIGVYQITKIRIPHRIGWQGAEQLLMTVAPMRIARGNIPLPHSHGSSVNCHTQTLFTFTQRRLRAFACTNVAQDQLALACNTGHQSRTALDFDRRAINTYIGLLKKPGRQSGLDDVSATRQRCGMTVGMDHFKERTADQLLRTAGAEHVHGSGVGIDHAIRFVNQHRVGRFFDEHAITRLAVL